MKRSDRERLDAAIAETFTEPDRDRHRGTRAVVVVHKGRIVAERYADGFSEDTPLMGWSMAKSIVNALVGILVAGESVAHISGSPNIVCRLIRVGGSLADYWAFPRRSLFDRIGMRSAVLEPDASGTFLGSSLAYATARDWARASKFKSMK